MRSRVLAVSGGKPCRERASNDDPDALLATAMCKIVGIGSLVGWGGGNNWIAHHSSHAIKR
jgi:hypothetical protein